MAIKTFRQRPIINVIIIYTNTYLSAFLNSRKEDYETDLLKISPPVFQYILATSAPSNRQLHFRTSLCDKFQWQQKRSTPIFTRPVKRNIRIYRSNILAKVIMEKNNISDTMGIFGSDSPSSFIAEQPAGNIMVNTYHLS